MKVVKRRLRVVSFVVLTSLFRFPLHSDGQTLRIGGIVAGQVNEMFTQEITPTSRSTSNVMFGPTVEMGLWPHLSIEVDALYRSKINYTTGPFIFISNTGTHHSGVDVKAHSWEIPALAEWHASERLMNLFVGGGVSFRRASGTRDFTDAVTPFIGNPVPPPYVTKIETSLKEYPHAQTIGGVIASGIDIHMSVFHLRPQVRYTRWNASPPGLYLKRDQIQVLMGISVGK